MTDFEKIANTHRAEIVGDPLGGTWAQCACGWVSDDAEAFEALASHAAHVHVVAGLAEPAVADGGEYTP